MATRFLLSKRFSTADELPTPWSASRSHLLIGLVLFSARLLKNKDLRPFFTIVVSMHSYSIPLVDSNFLYVCSSIYSETIFIFFSRRNKLDSIQSLLISRDEPASRLSVSTIALPHQVAEPASSASPHDTSKFCHSQPLGQMALRVSSGNEAHFERFQQLWPTLRRELSIWPQALEILVPSQSDLLITFLLHSPMSRLAEKPVRKTAIMHLIPH